MAAAVSYWQWFRSINTLGLSITFILQSSYGTRDMFFKYYNNSLNQVSKGFGKGLFVVGLLLVGFGVLVYIFKEVLAIIAATIFTIVGVVCCFNGIKIYLRGQIFKNSSGPEEKRENVRIHIDHDDSDF